MIRKILAGFLIVFQVGSAKGMATTSPQRYVGFDLGTSGARISIIESSSSSEYKEIHVEAIRWDAYDDADAWMNAVLHLFKGASKTLGGLESIKSICVSGTSASCLMIDRDTKEVTRNPRMYNYDVIGSANDNSFAKEAIELLEKHAPPKHTARARTGSLAKLLTWIKEKPLHESEVLVHQSDYISFMLMGESALSSDWHNCLKLGFDVREKQWPSWMADCFTEAGAEGALEGDGILPLKVVSPGEQMGVIDEEMAKTLGLSKDCMIVGGTTDSNAAFFAAAGTRPSFGTAVTSLGSTLAMKQLSKKYVEDASRGVYSHRFPDFEDPDAEAWLVGGASNCGCTILRELDFSNGELVELSKNIDPNTDSLLKYYPLTKPGERFPVADANKEPVLEPAPDNRKEYLHGILQAISDVERDGFEVLQELGAPTPSIVFTCGGGSNNDMWGQMRERRLSEKFPEADITVKRAESTEASYGSALLAAATFAN
jgi:xylulokinase